MRRGKGIGAWSLSVQPAMLILCILYMVYLTVLLQEQLQLNADLRLQLHSRLKVPETVMDRRTVQGSRMSPFADSASGTQRSIVQTMCRCDSGSMPVPTLDLESDVQDTGIVQESSLATSLAKMHFFVRKTTCECKPSLGEKTRDQYLQSISRLYCAPPPKDSNLSWDRLPDFGVQQKLPLFLGVLSYKSPRSLESSINNWVQGGIDTLGLQGTFVQLNGRSRLDDEVDI
jgi:hypothetical protein